MPLPYAGTVNIGERQDDGLSSNPLVLGFETLFSRQETHRDQARELFSILPNFGVSYPQGLSAQTETRSP